MVEGEVCCAAGVASHVYTVGLLQELLVTVIDPLAEAGDRNMPFTAILYFFASNSTGRDPPKLLSPVKCITFEKSVANDVSFESDPLIASGPGSTNVT
jgi:hypothetical protein